MYSHTPKRKSMDEQCLYTERVFSGAYERPGMGFLTMPFTQGTYMEVEPPRKRFHSGVDQRMLQNTGPTHREDRLAQCGANQLLNDKQIQDFIASTVLPHHRTLIGGIKWSNNQPERRPSQQRFQRKAVENMHPAFMPYAMELKNQAQALFIPQTNDVAQRATINKHEFTEGKVTSFPRGNYIPQASQEKVISMPQGFIELQDEEIIIIMEENPNEILCQSQEFSVTQGMTSTPQETRVSQQTQDNFICMPQGFGVTQGMQEKISSIPQGIRGSQQRQDNIICMPQGFSVPQETQEDIILNIQGINEPQRKRTEDDIIWIPQEISIPQGTLEEISFAPQGINIPLGKQEQDPATYDLSNDVDCKRPQVWETPVGSVTTTDLTAHNQSGLTNLGLVPQIETTQAEVQHEQTLKRNSADNVEIQLANINAESASQFSIAERSRAIAAEVFSEAAQYVAQENVDKKSRLEVTTDHEHERHTSLTRQPSGKRKRTKSAVVENAIKENPMKRQKVHMGAADITYQTYQTESDSSKKVWSKNNVELDEFMEDAIKILQGQSADLFPESVIDQLFKDTFESDIFLTSDDDFVVDPLVFFTSEFEQEINSL